jgi:hypothetical protein
MKNAAGRPADEKNEKEKEKCDKLTQLNQEEKNHSMQLPSQLE